MQQRRLSGSKGLKPEERKGRESDRGVHMLAYYSSTAAASLGKLGAAGAALDCLACFKAQPPFVMSRCALTPGPVAPLPVIFVTPQAKPSFQFVDFPLSTPPC